MSIEMDNPVTPLQKMDTATNLLAQMLIAHSVKDDAHFKKAYERAQSLLWDIQEYLEEHGAE